MAPLLSVRARSVVVLAVLLLALQVGVPAQPATGTISGTITDTSSAPLGFFTVEIVDAGGNWVTVAQADENGAFSVPGLDPGTYYARTYNYAGYVDEWYGGAMARFDNFAEGTAIVLGDGATQNIAFVLDLGGIIEGQIVAYGTANPIAGIAVEVYDSLGRFVGLTLPSDNSGYWSTYAGLPAGNYYLRTQNFGNWADQLYNNLPPYVAVTSGTPVPVTVGEYTSGINFALAPGGRISGFVADAGANALANVTITVKDSAGVLRATGVTDNFGIYTTTALPTGQFYVIASDGNRHIPEIYNNVVCLNCGIAGGAPVAVTVGATTGGIDFELAEGGSIEGTVTTAGTTEGIEGVRVEIYDSTGHLVGTTAASAPDGAYFSEFGLPGGTYYARSTTSGSFLNEVYSNLAIATPVLSGTPISVTLGQATTGIDFSLQATGPEIVVTQGATPVATGGLYDFGSRTLASDTDVVFTIANVGTVDLTASGLPLVPAGTDAGQFSITSQPVFPVAPSGSTTFTVRFHPTSAGIKTAFVSIGNNDANENPFVINFTGFVPGTPVITWPAPSAILFGTPLTVLQLNATADVPGTFAYTPDFGTVLPVGAYTLSVVFTPTDTVHYTTATADRGLVVVPVGGNVKGDFNGDLTADILWRHDTLGEVWLWPMNGTQRLSESFVRTVPDTNWEIRAIGDFDGDGMADIFWRNKVNGQLYLWPMNGANPQGEIYVGTVSTDYDIVGSGDFDGDGRSDLLWRHTTLGDVWIWLMNGATPLSEVYIDRVDPGYLVKGVGDLDADTKADIVWHHATTGEVWVWPMNGTTRLDQVWVGTVPDTGYQIEGVADFDGNGKADLVWRHATRGEVWIWTMNGPVRDAETWVGTVPDTNYQIAATGDYDGDTRADILWRNAVNGEVWMWLMNGTTKLSETWVGTVPDVGYQIVGAR